MKRPKKTHSPEVVTEILFSEIRRDGEFISITFAKSEVFETVLLPPELARRGAFAVLGALGRASVLRVLNGGKR